jgi:uncharacterized membrane protein
MIRKIAIGFAVLFALVVITGYMPGMITMSHMTDDGLERQMMGTYMISTVDDVTHGLTALVLLGSAIASRKAALIALTCFGWYYACDAAFYLVDGFLIHKPFIGNILLNLPHVIISSVMLWTVYVLGPKVVVDPEARRSTRIEPQLESKR